METDMKENKEGRKRRSNNAVIEGSEKPGVSEVVYWIGILDGTWEPVAGLGGKLLEPLQ
jgi:uncharacterized membrane protein YkgB